MTSSQMPLTAGKPEHRCWILAVLDRNRGGSCSALLLAPIGLFSVFLFLTYYLETIQGYSPVGTGLAFLPLTVTVLFSAGVSNTVLLPRVSPRLLVPAGLLLAAAGMALMTKIALHSSDPSPVLGVMPRSDIGPRGATTDRHTQPVRSVLARPPSGPERHHDPKAPCQPPGSSDDRSVAEIATDGAPACAELKGAS